MLDFVIQLGGVLLLIGLFGGIIYQLNWREPVAPGFVEEWDMMADFEPDTRTFQERLDEQRRLLKFQGIDVDKTG